MPAWAPLVWALAIVGSITLGWLYPAFHLSLRRRRRARWLALVGQGFGHDAPLAEDDLATAGLLHTIRSVFGPYSGLQAIVGLDAAPEHNRSTENQRFAFEVVYGRGERAWTYRRGTIVVASLLAKPLPLFTLKRPRGEAESRTTEYRVQGQPLVVQAIDGWELWARKADRRRTAKLARRLVTELAAEPGWELRGSDGWLVVFDEPRQSAIRDADALRRYLDRAVELSLQVQRT